MGAKSALSAGDWVEVRSKEEILATLDENGRLDGMPFMPEMFNFCGQRFRVFKRAHKTCDTVNKTGGRRVEAAVHLEGLRCDGSGHGGCGAGCLLYWKEAWLKAPTIAPATGKPGQGATEEQVRKAATPTIDSDGPIYSCQATELPNFSSPLSPWDIRQYWEDWRSGNARAPRMLASFFFRFYHRLIKLGIGLGAPLRGLYNFWQRLTGGPPYPFRRGSIPAGSRTPDATLNLQPGELVRVKTHEEILSTLDENNKNRGMYFDAEVVPFCKGVYRVRSRVDHIINERTGRMIQFKTGSVILENVYCTSRYSDRRLFCPRAIFPMWKEIWLERVDPASPSASTASAATTATMSR